MRLFIAIQFDNEVKSNLLGIIENLKNCAIDGNFTKEQNLHLTLVFIGETSRISDVKLVMDTLNEPSFDLKMSKLGTFKRQHGDICWVGIEKTNTLAKIYEHLKDGLIKKNFEIEDREYKPHITLGREVVVAKIPHFDVPSLHMRVRKISLMKSERINGKLTYTEIYSKNLRSIYEI